MKHHQIKLFGITLKDYYTYQNTTIKVKYALVNDEMTVNIKYTYKVGNLAISYKLDFKLTNDITIQKIFEGIMTTTDNFNRIATYQI